MGTFIPRGFAFAGLAAAAVSFPAFAPAQEPEDLEGIDSEYKSSDKLSETENLLLGLFKANVKRFRTNGKIYLKYDFEEQIEELVEDWTPELKNAKNRIRWARGIEGTPTTVEHGIIVGDYGEWIHKAEFMANVEVNIDLLSVARHKAGNILGPVFWNAKKKQSIGANWGHQVMCLKGCRPAKPLYPPQGREILSSVREVIGLKYDGRFLEATMKGKRMNDSGKLKKFTDGMTSGHVGLAWSGSVQCFIFSITIEGTLSPDWISKQLGLDKGKGK